MTYSPHPWAGWQHLPQIGVYAGLSCPNPLETRPCQELRLQTTDAVPSRPRFNSLRRRLEAYFLGANVDFEDDLDLEGASDFMVKAWKACQSIAKGEVRTYYWLAEQAGNRQGGTSRRLGHGPQSGADNHSLPSCHWQRRRIAWLRWRPTTEATIARD